jgi:hypothetical protein
MVSVWRYHIGKIEAKTFTIFIRVCSLFKSERLRASIKLTLHKAPVTSVMTYACPAWEFSTDAHLLKSQRCQNEAHRTTSKFPKRTSTRELHVAFKIRYVCFYYKIMQAESTSYAFMTMKMFATLEKAKPNIGNIRGLNLDTVKRTAVHMSSCLCNKCWGR